MLKGELYIGLRPALIPPTNKVILVYRQVFIVMAMTEVDMGLRPANFIHITTVK